MKSRVFSRRPKKLELTDSPDSVISDPEHQAEASEPKPPGVLQRVAEALDRSAHKLAAKLIDIGWPLVLRKVQGHSMVPVLPPGTNVWGNHWFQKLAVGDVIIFVHDGKEKIKRIAEIDGDQLYVLGDHEETSTDSRHFGWISRELVTAKVFWPHAPKSRSEHIEEL
jgi:nickel-type superoxide dismutase maturation protease